MSLNSIPIWVISLQGSERREFIKKQLDEANLDFEFFDAVNGAELSCSDVASIYDDFSARKRFGRKLSLPEIGCALSHQMIYKMIIQRNVPCALILEDDAILEDGFSEILHAALKIHSQFDLLSFFSSGAHLYKHKFISIEGQKFYRPSGDFYGAVAYIVTLSGALKLARTERIQTASDWPNVDPSFKAYVSCPNIVTHNYNLISSIKNSRDEIINSTKPTIQNTYDFHPSVDALLISIKKTRLDNILSLFIRITHIKWILLGGSYDNYNLYLKRDFWPAIRSMMPFFYINTIRKSRD